jgi:type IX secretion system PorP/SprF family membrane protein
MSRIKHLLTILFIGASLAGSAQQEPQITHFMFNQLGFNPGFTGVRDAICVNILARQQWVGFTDGEDKVFPQTNLFTLDAPINRLFGRNVNSGLGIAFLTDKIGFEENLQVRLSYAYRFNLGPGKMAVGASVGFLNKTIDFSKYIPIDEGDPLLQGKGKESDMLTDIAIGAHYAVAGRYYVGLAVTQLLQDDFSAVSINETPYALQRHFYLNGGYYHELAGTNWILNPNLLLKSDMGSTQIDINALGIYNNKIWGGLTYRAFDAVAFLVGAYPFDTKDLDALRIGYSYDLTTSKLGRGGRSFGSHELYANYCFRIIIERIPTGYSDVRYLPTL